MQINAGRGLAWAVLMIAENLGPSSNRIFAAADAEIIAQRRLPKLVFDFLQGGVGNETALAVNHQALAAIKLQPRALLDVSQRDLTASFLGRDYALPFGIAPMGMCNLTHPRADHLLADLARSANIPVCLSTAASTSIEQMQAWAPDHAWFQLYVGQNQEDGLAMADRAAAAGYQTLILTVDTPHVSRRARDLRNGFQVPFRIGLTQFIDFALHPQWSLSVLAQGRPAPANFDPTTGGFRRDEPRAGADWGFLDRLRDRWQGQLVVKGVTSPQDAVRIRDAGADAIWVSNHGGRQLDSVPAAIDFLPIIRAAVGPELPMIFCSGARTGDDIVKALALGANFVMIGRPWMYALGAEGGRGLVSIARILAEDVSTVMAQIGACSLDQITPDVLAATHLAQMSPNP